MKFVARTTSGIAGIWSIRTALQKQKYAAAAGSIGTLHTGERRVTVHMSKTDRSQTIPTTIRRLHPPVPIEEHLGEWVSDWYLVLTQTPSARIWTIALWRSGYAKDNQPWRNLVNHPVPGDVIAIYELPPKDYHEDHVRYNKTNLIRWPNS